MVTVGGPCPADLASATGLGQCIVGGDGAGGIRIMQADPRIAVSGRLLLDWHDMVPPGFSLRLPGRPRPHRRRDPGRSGGRPCGVRGDVRGRP